MRPQGRAEPALQVLTARENEINTSGLYHGFESRGGGGKSAIIVFSNLSRTGSWETSYWDFFRDGTFALIGRHEDGKIRPTRFEFWS